MPHSLSHTLGTFLRGKMKQGRFLNCQEATSLHTHPLRYNTLPLTSPTELEMVLELSAPLAYLCLSVE